MSSEQVGQSDEAREKHIRIHVTQTPEANHDHASLVFVLRLLDEARLEMIKHPEMFEDQFTTPKLATVVKKYPIFSMSEAGFGHKGWCAAVTWESVREMVAGLLKRDDPSAFCVRLRDDWAKIAAHMMDKEQAELEKGDRDGDS